MKKEIEQIKKRLDEIERVLFEKHPQEMCSHTWEEIEGSNIGLRLCRKCQRIENFSVLDKEQCK